MKYISTRGTAPHLNFEQVLLAGLASDGGLYVPQTWPKFDTAALRAMAGRPYGEIAQQVMQPFVGDFLSPQEFRALIDEAYAGFNHRAVAPLVQSGPSEWLLELHRGPTLAFKDVAMQLLARLMDRALGRQGRRATVVCATSGDTGGAAVEAFAGRSCVDLFVLMPKGRVSAVQRAMMSTSTAPNIHALEIDGTFDDCQNLLKAMFAWSDFRQRQGLAAVNSINWARIMAQMVYYFTAAIALGAPDREIDFCVPTGNFGDIFAGHVARHMGLPIRRLTIATNVNDILVRTFAAGYHEMTGVTATDSPSMDIQISSNFERLVFELVNKDAGVLTGLMSGLAQSGAYTLPPSALEILRRQFDAGRATMAQTKEMIAQVYQRSSKVIDPHTAVALHVARARKEQDGVPMVVVSTAHAAKFPDAVEAATGARPALPAAMAGLMERPEHLVGLDNDLEKVAAYIDAHSSTNASNPS
ncbi:MAG: threonine synthase [Alphaproteobacteria bacterium]